ASGDMFSILTKLYGAQESWRPLFNASLEMEFEQADRDNNTAKFEQWFQDENTRGYLMFHLKMTSEEWAWTNFRNWLAQSKYA
ncbi:hypothetical protein KIPB_008978, partial [Kipferlia bialata]